MKKHLGFATLAALLFAPAIVDAAPITVDDLKTNFNGGTITVNGGGIKTDSPGVSGAGILGTRVGSVNSTDNGSGTSTASFAIGGGTAAIGTNSTVTAATFTLTYTFSPLNLTNAGSIGITIGNFDQSDLNPGTPNVKVTVVDPQGTNNLGPQNITGNGAINFALGGLPANQTDGVTQLVFTFTLQGRGQDFTLTSDNGGITIREIPEPASLAVFGLMAVAGGVWYRRRRAAA